MRKKRKKSAECVGGGELGVDGGSVMRFRNLHGIPSLNIHDGDFRHWVAVMPIPVFSRSRTKLTLTR